MASKKKEIAKDEVVVNTEESLETKESVEDTKVETKKSTKEEPKYPVGSIVLIAKDADADLNGFKLFPQYKKYNYTVEAYDGHTGVYSLRRLNLSLRLKESEILAPHEKDSPLVQKQY